MISQSIRLFGRGDARREEKRMSEGKKVPSSPFRLLSSLLLPPPLVAKEGLILRLHDLCVVIYLDYFCQESFQN